MASRRPAPPALPLLALLLCAGARLAGAVYSIAPSSAQPSWSGIGASFTGASAKLVRDYAEPWRTQLLDFLFSPSGAPSTYQSFRGAALTILRLEVGGDANSDGGGSAPSHMHSASDAPTAARGWAWWLASEAAKRNPGVKVMLVPVAWPAFLRGGNPTATDPFSDPGTAAAYVGSYASLFQAQSGAAVGYVGLWASDAADVSALPQMVEYAVELRGALDAAGLTSTKIVCADSSADWNCLAAIDPSSTSYNARLAAVVGVVGNAGRPGVVPSSVPEATPLWVTSMYNTYVGRPQPSMAYGAIAASNEWIETVVNASLMGSARLPTAFIYAFGATGTGYGLGPNWRLGIVEADQPWSGNFYPTVVTWAIAAVNQFVPSDGTYKLNPVGSGTGTLDNGGYYASFWSPIALEFVVIAQKFYAIEGWVRDVSDESANFMLTGELKAHATEVDVWRSCFSTYKDNSDWQIFHHVGTVPVSGNSFSVDLQAGCLYSISGRRVGSFNPSNGCLALNCEAVPPPPTPMGSQNLSFTDADSCPTVLGPGRLLVDVNGAFECTTDDPVLGPALRQTASGKPISPFGDTRPHSLTGDLDATDNSIAVDMAISSGQKAMIGARVSPGTFAANSPDDLNRARGFWLVLAPGPGALAWSVVHALDDSTFNGAPALSGSVATAGDLSGQWFRAKLALRGTRAVGSVVVGGSATLLFNTDASLMRASGFVGIGTGDFVAGGASFRNLAVSGETTICDAAPAQGQAVTVEMCSDGAAGQVFTFVRPPGGLDASAFSYSVFASLDASGEDCGTKMSTGDNATQRALTCAANFSATAPGGGACACAGWNGNGYPKGDFTDLARDDSVSLFVLQPPPMQVALAANLSLCLSLGGPDPGNPLVVVDACADASAPPPEQLWYFERSIQDGVLLSGPMRNVKAGASNAVDFADFSVQVGGRVMVDGWNKGSNQVLWHPFPSMTGIIRAVQMGVCLGACRSL